jgi:CIC family chloride channel protein
MTMGNFHIKLKIYFLAILVGIISGLLAIGFKYVLKLGFNYIQSMDSKLLLILLPFSLIVFVIPIRKFLLSKNNQGFGVAQVMYEIEHIQTHVMKPLSLFYKILATIITLLSGYSVGIHGPVAHLGGAVGSNIAYNFKISDDEARVLIGCGVAAALSAVFHAPIFATLFVVEIIFKKRYFDTIGTILLSSIFGFFIARIFNLTPYISLPLIEYQFSLKHTISFVLLGILMGILSILYVEFMKKSTLFFNQYLKSPLIKSILGSLVFFLVYLFLSDIFSYNININKLIESNLNPYSWMLLSFLIIVLTSVTLASGGMGGIFAPGLAIGFSMGIYLNTTFLGLFNSPLIFGLLAMSAMFSGFAIAPLTATFLLVEFTGNYHLLIPGLITSLAASSLSEFFIQESVYHNSLKRIIEINDESS